MAGEGVPATSRYRFLSNAPRIFRPGPLVCGEFGAPWGDAARLVGKSFFFRFGFGWHYSISIPTCFQSPPSKRNQDTQSLLVRYGSKHCFEPDSRIECAWGSMGKSSGGLRSAWRRWGHRGNRCQKSGTRNTNHPSLSDTCRTDLGIAFLLSLLELNP